MLGANSPVLAFKRAIRPVFGGSTKSRVASTPRSSCKGASKASKPTSLSRTAIRYLSSSSTLNLCKSSPSLKRAESLQEILAPDLRQMMKYAVASKRDKGDFTPSSMLKQVVQHFQAHFEKRDSDGLYRFFLDMNQELSADTNDVKAKAQRFLDNINSGRETATILASQAELRDSLSGSYEKLFELILALPGGMKVLIDMRQALLDVLKKVTLASKTNASAKVELSQLKLLETSLRAQLQHWFSIGFLDLRRVTWESPAALLEKIAKYSDSVHPMADWKMLKTRISQNRRCFGFFHPSMPLEPLVFIEVALTNEISSKIQPILQGVNEVSEQEANTAIFYAITSTQPGLAGVDLGHMLIEHVVDALRAELPHLQTFSTFSPIPTFKVWLDSQLSHAISGSKSFLSSIGVTEELSKKIMQAHQITGKPAVDSTEKALTEILTNPTWAASVTLHSAIQPVMEKLAAHYLANERKRDLAVDPVANFHLRNGAELHRICFLADTSAKRLDQSYGLMVNYLYRLERLAENNEAYLTKGRIATSTIIDNLLARASSS